MPKVNVDIDSQPIKQIDAITIYAMIREMNENLMTQARATNNNVAGILQTTLALQKSISNLIENLTETRDHRYQEEIDSLEEKMSALVKELEQKKAAKVENKSTAERIQTAAKEAVTEIQAEERKKKSIDWIGVRDTMIKAAAGAIAVAIITFLALNAPGIGEFIKSIFVR
jgi:chromosome segregation ATPase